MTQTVVADDGLQAISIGLIGAQAVALVASPTRIDLGSFATFGAATRLIIPMTIEERIHIAVPPMLIDHIWSEVDRWHMWDPDTKQARLDGPFAVGATGRISPSKGMGVPMAITERTEGQSFTVEAYIPLFRMHFEHTVTPVAGGSDVVHRVWFTGALAFLFGPGVAKQVREGLPRTMQSLKAYAEQRHKLIIDAAELVARADSPSASSYLPVGAGAMRESDSNRFHVRHGFVLSSKVSSITTIFVHEIRVDSAW